jgi:hypothetical protein
MAKTGGKARQRPPMEPSDVEGLLVMLCHSSPIRAQASVHLRREFFREDEARYALLAMTLCGLPPEYSEVESIPFVDLQDLVMEAERSPGGELSESDCLDLFHVPGKKTAAGLIHHCCNAYGPGDFTLGHGMGQLKRFLKERGGYLRVMQVMRASGSFVDEGLRGEITSAADEMSRFDAIGAAGGANLSAMVKAKKVFEVTPTMLTFVDTLLGDGFVDEEVVGLTGGTNWGKSTLTHQVAISMARVFQIQEPVKGRLRSSLVISYEDPKSRMFDRAMAYICRIKKGVLFACRDPEVDLCKGPSLYDAELAAIEHVSPGAFPSEYDRYRAGIAELDVNYRCFDMLEPGMGSGGVDEIVALVAADIAASGQQPGAVFIDSIDLLARNWISAQPGGDIQRQMPSLVPLMVTQIRKKVGVAFGCTVFISNQLAGADLGKRSTAKLDHSNAGGSKNWGTALDYHLLLGSPTDYVSVLTCTKARRSEVGKDVLIKLDGQFGRWLDASDEYTRVNGNIVPRNVGEVYQVPAAKPPKKAPKSEAEYYDFDADE